MRTTAAVAAVLVRAALLAPAGLVIVQVQRRGFAVVTASISIMTAPTVAVAAMLVVRMKPAAQGAACVRRRRRTNAETIVSISMPT